MGGQEVDLSFSVTRENGSRRVAGGGATFLAARYRRRWPKFNDWRRIDMVAETVASLDRPKEPPSGGDLRLVDLMILVAGLALALAADAPILVLLAREAGRLGVVAAAHLDVVFSNWPMFWRAAHDHLRNTLWYGFQAAEMFLVGMTPAFFVLRLKRPRPPLKVILRNSGTLAGLAIVFGFFWVTGLVYLCFPESLRSETGAAIVAGETVAFVWGVMALCRRWVAEPSWPDRIGRLLGITAIGAALVGLVVFRI
jgi:hypothetical protein